MNPEVDWFFDEESKWKEEYQLLRKIALECGVREELKWGKPCYTYKGANVFLIHGFKDYCALLFHKGALLKDTERILVQQTTNVQAARQLRFTKPEEIMALEDTIRAYIFEAVEVEKAGLEVKMKKTSEFEMPGEFKRRLEENPDLDAAFKALTPGRQRGYLLYFSRAKQSKTRESRIDKSIPKIFNGQGPND